METRPVPTAANASQAHTPHWASHWWSCATRSKVAPRLQGVKVSSQVERMRNPASNKTRATSPRAERGGAGALAFVPADADSVPCMPAAMLFGRRGADQRQRAALGGRDTSGQYQRAIKVKSEIRSPKPETNPKSPTGNAQNQRAQWRLGLWNFSVGACFEFRASDFGFRRSQADGTGKDVWARGNARPTISSRIAGAAGAFPTRPAKAGLADRPASTKVPRCWSGAPAAATGGQAVRQ